MGLYNMLFGETSEAALLLKILSLTRADFYRYRDCYRAEGDQIAVYTRGGGNNRWVYDDDLGQTEQEEPQHLVLRKNPLYIVDEDDDFDSNYRTFYFRVPGELTAVLERVPFGAKRDEVWSNFLVALKDKSEALR